MYKVMIDVSINGNISTIDETLDTCRQKYAIVR